MLQKDNRDNLGSFHSLWLAKAKSLPNNDFNEDLFTKIEFTQNTGQWNKPLRNSVNGSYYEHTLQITIPKYRPEVEDFLLLNIDVPLIAYIKLHNGDLVRIGTKESPFLLSSDFTSGTGAQGFNSYTFNGKATEVLKRNFGVTLPTLPPQADVPLVLQNARLILSVRRVRQAYIGPCFTLRRDSDNATQNFGFLPNGELDVAAIVNFKGTASLYVRSWYDQSGNNANFFQIDSSKQPQLLLAGNAGRAEINFGNNIFLETDANIYTAKEPRTMLMSSMYFSDSTPSFCFGQTSLSVIILLVILNTIRNVVYSSNTQFMETDIPITVGNYCFTWVYPGASQVLKFYKNNLLNTLSPIDTNPVMTYGASINKAVVTNSRLQEVICCDGVLDELVLTDAQNNIINFFNLD